MAAPFDRALRHAIDDVAATVPGTDLTRAVDALSRRYRDGAGASGAGAVGRLTEAERLAYAVVRLPATSAALDAVLAAVARHTRIEPRTVTDLGAGPGTVLWPALSRWPALERITLVDRDPDLLRLGLRMWRHDRGEAEAAPTIDVRTGDLAAGDAPAADLVIVSYAIGELPADRMERAIDRALALASGALVVIEPGTPAGFARIRAIRTRLIAAGATIAAPCPHEAACPMAGDDWCHVAVRLDRSRAHRQSKHAALGWEDEKFSYVVAVRDPSALRARADARIVRRPQKGTGHVRLALCARDGLADAVVTRRTPDYRDARDAVWGDPWPLMEATTDELDSPIA